MITEWPPLFEAICLVVSIMKLISAHAMRAYATKKIEASSCKLYATVKSIMSSSGPRSRCAFGSNQTELALPTCRPQGYRIILAIGTDASRNVWNSRNKGGELFLHLSRVIKLCDAIFVSCYTCSLAASQPLPSCPHAHKNLLRNSPRSA